MTLQLKAGQSYERRDGGREDNLQLRGGHEDLTYKYKSKSGNIYMENGRFDEFNECGLDLIREWPTEPQKPNITLELPSLRDLMATAALTGFLAGPKLNTDDMQSIANNAYEIAGFMMKARGNTNDTGKSDDV